MLKNSDYINLMEVCMKTVFHKKHADQVIM